MQIMEYPHLELDEGKMKSHFLKHTSYIENVSSVYSKDILTFAKGNNALHSLVATDGLDCSVTIVNASLGRKTNFEGENSARRPPKSPYKWSLSPPEQDSPPD